MKNYKTKSVRKYQRNRLWRVHATRRPYLTSTLKGVLEVLPPRQGGDRRLVKRVLDELESDRGWLSTSTGGFKDIMVSREEAEMLEDIASSLDVEIDVEKING